MQKTTDITLLAEQLEGTEATFSTWLVAVGDRVESGQPIAELETDKVAMEVCAPVSGVIQFLLVNTGEKIEPDQCLGIIVEGVQSVSVVNKNVSTTSHTEEKLANDEQIKGIESDLVSKESISPAVRRLLTENNFNIESIKGSGKRGRVTRDDVIKFKKSEGESKISLVSNENKLEKLSNDNISAPINKDLPIARLLQGKMHQHSNMRRSIANHMVKSLLETSPHVTSVFEMDMGNIIEHRKCNKKKYSELGVKLTFTAYFLSAMAQATKIVPQVNARFHENALEIFDDVNIGVGTALGDKGLVVPVVQQVQAMNLLQIAQSLSMQTEKARTGKLTPGDMKNGTLTISNHGVSGSLLATPIIINQPQVAILGIGKLEKRVIVKEVDGDDVMVIRPRCYVTLSIDHRALDAYQTNLYLSEFVSIIENWDDRLRR